MLFIKNLHMNKNSREVYIIWKQRDDLNNSSVLLQWHECHWRCTQMSQTLLFPWFVSMLSSIRGNLPWKEFHRTDFCHPSSQGYSTRWKRELHCEYHIFNTLWSTCKKKDNGAFETCSTEKRPNSSVETSMINSIEVEFKISCLEGLQFCVQHRAQEVLTGIRKISRQRKDINEFALTDVAVYPNTPQRLNWCLEGILSTNLHFITRFVLWYSGSLASYVTQNLQTKKEFRRYFFWRSCYA